MKQELLMVKHGITEKIAFPDGTGIRHISLMSKDAVWAREVNPMRKTIHPTSPRTTLVLVWMWIFSLAKVVAHANP
jgi:hypothetical protein